MKFTFTAINSSGERASAVEDADSQDELALRLQLRGLYVINIKPQADIPFKEQKSFPKVKARKFTHSRIKEDDLTVFARQVAVTLDSGVPLLKSLKSILRQVPSRRFYDLLSNVSQDVENGLSFRDSLAKHPKVFSSLWVNLVETGEASGNLPTILERLAGYLERRAALKRKTISAMVYPLILVAVALSAMFIFVIAVIPKFQEIFSNFDIQLPAPTQVLIGLSSFLRGNFLLLLIVSVGIIIGIFRFRRTETGRAFFDRLLFNLPLIKEYLRLAETERFASTMSTLLESGVPILYALEISARSAGSVIARDIISKVKDEVREGRALSRPLDESDFFPPMVIQMIDVGEEVGELDKMFKRIAGHYSEIMETMIERFAAAFEPLMIVVMGITIGTMVIAMFLPIFELTNIGSQ